MSTRSWCAALIGVLLASAAAGSAFAQGFGAAGPNLGKPISPADIAAWDISIMPDGTGLPSGSGTAAQGAPIYAQKCAVCHGDAGKGGLAAALVGGQPVSNAIETTKTIANFWPYASTLFDFIRRAMPWNKPRTLTNDEVYGLTAYILALNKIIGENDVDERSDAAEGPDAEPRWVHAAISGQDSLKRNATTKTRRHEASLGANTIRSG